eukprot:1741331-Prorocentrum_lima.AAC.1
MAHTGQLDDLAPLEVEEQNSEMSIRQEVSMMKGLIHMMKQQLKEIRETPSLTKDVKGRQEDNQ